MMEESRYLFPVAKDRPGVSREPDIATSVKRSWLARGIDSAPRDSRSCKHSMLPVIAATSIGVILESDLMFGDK